MDFTISKAQKQIINAVGEFAENNLNEEQYLEEFSPDMWKMIADFGLLGITVSEVYGGLGEDNLTAALVFEELGYRCKNNGLIFAVNNHIWVTQNLIYLYGSEFLKNKYLETMIKGEKIGAIAITEVEAGSDALNMMTTAVECEDGYLLNGNKMFISNGPIGDVFIVFALTEKEPIRKLTAFVVDRSIDGVKVGPNIEKMGLGACPTSEIIFSNCRITKNNILGKLNQGMNILTSALEWERCYEFVPHIGVMRRIMEKCTEHASTRKQFSKPIGDYQSISHKITDMKVSIEMARLMMYKIATLKDKNRTAYIETSIFKLYVSEHYIQTCRDAIQIFGGYGYTKEYEVERELRDALACSIYSGTNEMQKNTIFKMLSTYNIS